MLINSLNVDISNKFMAWNELWLLGGKEAMDFTKFYWMLELVLQSLVCDLCI
jgi:hypothetical protein